MKKADVFVYIAGKHNDDSIIKIEKNVLDSLEIAIKCADYQINYFCPHIHSKFVDHHSSTANWHYWMQLDKKIIEKLTNCMIMVSNFTTSKGAMTERGIATDLGQPIFKSFETFFEWYNTLEE